MKDEFKRSLLDETKLRATTKKLEEKKQEDQKKKKHKKKKLPKNVDTSKPADPERWLPKWKRAKYRKLFKKYGKSRETQGEASASGQIGACISFILSCNNFYFRWNWTKYSCNGSIQIKVKEEIIFY
jgi:hypothetical protein